MLPITSNNLSDPQNTLPIERNKQGKPQGIPLTSPSEPPPPGFPVQGFNLEDLPHGVPGCGHVATMPLLGRHAVQVHRQHIRMLRQVVAILVDDALFAGIK